MIKINVVRYGRKRIMSEGEEDREQPQRWSIFGKEKRRERREKCKF